MSKLNLLSEWTNKASVFLPLKSAQAYLQPAMAGSGGGPSSCGAGDEKPTEIPKPSACGSPCGAGDDKPASQPEEKPEEKPKPSACGSPCAAKD